MSEVKVNKISPRSGTDVALGDSGDSFNVPSGAAIAVTGDLKSSTLKDSAGAVVISKSGTAVTLGASGDTVQVASGATLEGSGLRILRYNAEQAEVEKDILTYNSKVAQSQKMEEANFARMQGQVAKNEAKIAEYGYYAKAGTSLLRMGGYTV